MATVTSRNMIAGLAGWTVFVFSPVQADDPPFIQQKQQSQTAEQRLETSIPFVRLTEPFSDNLVQSAATLDTQEQLRQQERQHALQQQQTPDSDIRLTRPGVRLSDYPADEHPCFTINTLRLEGDSARRFQWVLDAAGDAKGRCLGGQGILLVNNKVQNAILTKGYVTTRVMVQEQDLTGGVLTLTLQPGRIAHNHGQQH
ncbi:putative hemolysin activation protein HecB [Xenorhabdus sp. TS4]|nr:putative hemolysin activation protein HecB [Xenorhabdus sp. TS4]